MENRLKFDATNISAFIALGRSSTNLLKSAVYSFSDSFQDSKALSEKTFCIAQ